MRNWYGDWYMGLGVLAEPDQSRYSHIQELMATGQMIGPDRPIGRVSWSNDVIQKILSDRPGPWRRLQGQSYPDLEIPGVKSINIDRALGDDCATCTIVLYNDLGLADGAPEGVDDLGRPGYLTYSRGVAATGSLSVYNQFAPPAGGSNQAYLPDTTITGTWTVTDADSSTFTGLDDQGGPVTGSLVLNREQGTFTMSEVAWERTGTTLTPGDMITGTWTTTPMDNSTEAITFTGLDNQGNAVTGSLVITNSQGAVQDTIGEHSYLTNWGYPRGFWYDKLIPNRLLRTYQGYGSLNMDDDNNQRSFTDPLYVGPWHDKKLVTTGTWLIDTVTFSTDGLITIQCRDLGKLLLEQVVYPPMIPLARFPLTYCPDAAAVATAATGAHATISTDRINYPSGSAGAAHEQHEDSYPGGYVYGHHARDAFDSNPDTYYLSHSYPSSTGGSEEEWIQGSCNGATINQLKVRTYGIGYVCYISVMEDGDWQGGSVIPYTPDGHSHGSGIPYVSKRTFGTESQTINLPRAYRASIVRLTFTHLRDFNLDPLPYRVGVRQIQAFYYTPDTYRAGTYTPSTVGVPGNIGDWSDVIKELCGWAGFVWRANANEYGEPGLEEGRVGPDPLFGRDNRDDVELRCHGDIETLGAGPIECTPPDFFLNKSFMECCKTVADFIGCVFYIDEWGRVNFRMPNIFSGGNLPQNPHLSITHLTNLPYHHNEYPVEFHENANLQDYSVTIDDSQVRSEVLVVGTNPDVNSSSPLAGGVILSGTGASSAVNFTNVLGGQYRLFLVPGEATKGFTRVEECQRMAELIGMKILFSYRKGSARIVGHPYLQLDDQVRIFERVTNELNIHYVSGISSQMDTETGAWTMDVTTHWLGQDPNTDWFVDYLQLTPAVSQLSAILARLGSASPGTAPV